MAKYNIKQNVAVISLNNPPVNSLSSKVRKAIYDAATSAAKDSRVAAIIICGDGRTFSGGADITEFNSGHQTYPNLRELVDVLENSSKPIIAAVHGYALGGGLEIALSCHYRVSLSTAKFGLPEVKLGILPGAGGTQRLPRLIGLDNAMTWITLGDEYSAKTAANLGLVDRIYPANADIIQNAVQFARSVTGKSLTNRRISRLTVRDASLLSKIFSKHKDKVSKKFRGAMAPRICLEVIQHSANLPYEEGMKKERDALEYLIGSDQSKALIYLFFAQRQVRKWMIPGSNVNSTNTSALNVKSVAVIGLGTMGRGIVLSLVKAGIPNIFVLEMNQSALSSGLTFVKNVLEKQSAKGEISEKRKSELLTALQPISVYEDLKDVDLVIEAAFESMQVKKEIFRKLDRVCKSSAVLATNTSALDIDEISSVTQRPQQVVGMHFFAPAHVMKLLENVHGLQSSPKAIATAMDMGRRMGKVTVLVGNCNGFVGNRMFRFYQMESDFLLEEGLYPNEVDEVLKKFGFAMGRYQVGDLSGNDIGYRMRSRFELTNKQQPTGSPERERFGQRYCPLADLLVESGRFGYKSDGKGWFKYVGKQKELTVDSEVTKMIDDYRKRNCIVPRRITEIEVLERMLYPMINEGFKILEEGIACNPWEIDIVLIYGYAWPRHTGGPMFYAHSIGLPHVLRVIEEHWNAAGTSEPHWKPSRMLINLVKNHGNPHIMSWTSLGKESMKSAL